MWKFEWRLSSLYWFIDCQTHSGMLKRSCNEPKWVALHSHSNTTYGHASSQLVRRKFLIMYAIQSMQDHKGPTTEEMSH